jgi:small-conductance mechanosensitive channel
VIASVTDACGLRPGLFCEWIYNQTNNDSAARLANWLVDKPLRITLILVVAYFIRRAVHTAIDHLTQRLAEESRPDGPIPDETKTAAGRRAMRIHTLAARAEQRSLTLGAVLRSASTIVIYVIALFLVLSELQINLAPLIASAGIVGIALGFGAQSVVRDFLSGIFIILEDHYGVGDIVDTGVATGKVEEVSLRTTRLRDQAGTLWIVPNGAIRRVGNTSQLWSNAVIDVEVAYETDIDFAIATIKDVLDEIWKDKDPAATVLEEPKVLGVEALGDSSVIIRAVVRCEPAEQWAMGRIARKRIKQALDTAGIEIPFPQRTVWIRQDATV